jgi:hypothetical protein
MYLTSILLLSIAGIDFVLVVVIATHFPSATMPCVTHDHRGRAGGKRSMKRQQKSARPPHDCKVNVQLPLPSLKVLPVVYPMV